MSSTNIISDIRVLLNYDVIRDDVNVAEIERQMMSSKKNTPDPGDKFKEELHRAAEKLGVPMNDLSESDNDTAADSDDCAEETEETEDVVDHSRYRPPRQEQRKEPHRDQRREPRQEQSYNYDDYSDYSDDDATGYREEPARGSSYNKYAAASAAMAAYRQSYGALDRSNMANRRHGAARSSSSESESSDEDPLGRERRSHYSTREQERRATIASVTGSNSGFSLEREKAEETKAIRISEIDWLIDLLGDQVDLSRIPKVNEKSSDALVNHVLTVLRHKNDQLRCCSFAEESILAGAYALEEIFNGERIFFDKYQPDLTGWHTHVQCKLRRMRADTHAIVSGAMSNGTISPGMRIAVELIPNLFNYSRLKSQQRGTPGIISDDELVRASNNIRDLN